MVVVAIAAAVASASMATNGAALRLHFAAIAIPSSRPIHFANTGVAVDPVLAGPAV